MFCDFGNEFIVSDIDGEPPVSVLISSVTKVMIILIVCGCVCGYPIISEGIVIVLSSLISCC